MSIVSRWFLLEKTLIWPKISWPVRGHSLQNSKKDGEQSLSYCYSVVFFFYLIRLQLGVAANFICNY